MRIRESRLGPSDEYQIIGRPRKEQVKVHGMLMPNYSWSFSDAQAIHPELTEEQFRSLTLAQQTKLAGELSEKYVITKRLKELQEDKSQRNFGDSEVGQTCNQEVSETNFDKPEISLDLIIEKGVMALEGIACLVSSERRRRKIELQQGIVDALKSEPPSDLISSEVEMYLSNF